MTKTENIVLRVDSELKRNFEKKASARQMSLTTFLLRLISDGAAIESQRRERVRQVAIKMNN